MFFKRHEPFFALILTLVGITLVSSTLNPVMANIALAILAFFVLGWAIRGLFLWNKVSSDERSRT